MKNDFFENEEYKIKNGVLEEYLGEKKKVVINSSIDGHAVTKIGTFAFGTKKIDTLILQEGITEIQEAAFYRTYIKSLVLPTTITKIEKNIFHYYHPQNIVISRKMSKIKWNGIRKKCIPIVGEQFLLTNSHTGDYAFDAIIESYSQKNLFYYAIDESMMTLFSVGQDRADIVFDDKKIKSRGFMIQYLIRNGMLLTVNEETDCFDDNNYRSHNIRTAREIVLCKLSVEDEGNNWDNVVVKAHFVQGIYYFMRIEKIIYKGKTYYVSSREFLNPDKKVPYIKKVESVYNVAGMEVTEKEKEMVLKKYNLLRDIP